MLRSYQRLLQGNPNFRWLWLAQVVSEIGDWFYSLAIYTMLLDYTGQATSIALALVFQVLPQTLAGPAAGMINDRLSRKQVMIVADLARVVIVLAMLLVRGARDTWLLYSLLTLETIMAAFFEPARNAVIPNIVTPEETLTANTLSASTWSFILAIGATLGGVVAAVFGRSVVFLLNAVSFSGSAYFIARMRFEEPHRVGAAPFRLRELVDFSPTVEGLRYIYGKPRLFFPIFLKVSTGVLAASWVVFPIYASRLFFLPGVGPQRNTMLVTSIFAGVRGLGALTGPLLSSGWAGESQRRMSQLVLGGFLLAASGYAIFAAAPSIAAACAGLFIAHSGGAMIWVNSTTILQINSEDRFRGRVFAADLAIAMFAVAAAGLGAGIAIDRGVSPRTVAFSIAICQLVLCSTWVFALRLWSCEKPAAF